LYAKNKVKAKIDKILKNAINTDQEIDEEAINILIEAHNQK